VLSSAARALLRSIIEAYRVDERVVIEPHQRALFEQLKKKDLIYFEGRWTPTCDGLFLADPMPLSRICLSRDALHVLREIASMQTGRLGPGKGPSLLWQHLAELGFLVKENDGLFGITEAGRVFSERLPKPPYLGGAYPYRGEGN
jgi:hypothetical protein